VLAADEAALLVLQVREEDVMLCACAPGPDGKGCGDDCLNRSLFYECNPRFCRCEESCKNQRFQRRSYARIEMRRAGRKGMGLFCSDPLTKGQFITEYVGEVLDERTYAARKAQYDAEGKRHMYFMSVSGTEVIDACHRGNLGRFINHSCSPNCETQKWMVNGELCIGLFALQDIPGGTELTFDYNFERYGDKPMRCLCGAKNCRGFIGGKGDGRDDGEEEDWAEEDEPEPIMLPSDGMENDAFEKAEADATAAEAERAARRERERAERVARREAADAGRSARKTATPGSSKKRAVASGSWQQPFVKRSEVDRRLDELLSSSGSIKHKEAVRPLLRLFHVALVGDAGGGDEGGTSVSSRDVSLLLEAVLKTTAPGLQRTLLECSALSIFHLALPRLVGADILLPVLRKLLRVLDLLPLTEQLVRHTRSADGLSLLDALRRLERASDVEVSRRARDLCGKLCAPPNGGAGLPQAMQYNSPLGVGGQYAHRPPAGIPYQQGYQQPCYPDGTPDERVAKRARSFGNTQAESVGYGHHYASQPPPPPLPAEPPAPPPPPPPPPPQHELMELAPVGSPGRDPVVVPVVTHTNAAARTGEASKPGAPAVYSSDTVVPWPSKAEVASLPETWESPYGEPFKAAVLILVAYRLGKYRQPEHPMCRVVRAGADDMVRKLAGKVLDRERRKADEQGGAAKRGALQKASLSEKIKTFVQEHVHQLATAAK